ncbi:hypothetical protein HPB51_026571 [Rhipicephalus microplus]|uniref:Uncharacterized protein n=1 Tax=Rhipicephalus microplus TaxID=6941 RepID=A0A9J6D2A1_RHIMP|nr:hypothetical protein HPB51_026571 [Rhipicephalus microplus]
MSVDSSSSSSQQSGSSGRTRVVAATGPLWRAPVTTGMQTTSGDELRHASTALVVTVEPAVESGVAEHGFDQPPHSEQLSQRRPWWTATPGPSQIQETRRHVGPSRRQSKSTLPPTDHKGSDTSVSSGCSYSPLPPSVVPDFKTPYFEQFHSAFKDCTIRKNPSEGLVMRCDVCRVMRSTNIAETSITVEDMTYVVDTGLHREQRFNPPMGLSLLCMFPTFQANVQQRAGHAGRVRLLSQ